MTRTAACLLFHNQPHKHSRQTQSKPGRDPPRLLPGHPPCLPKHCTPAEVWLLGPGGVEVVMNLGTKQWIKGPFRPLAPSWPNKTSWLRNSPFPRPGEGEHSERGLVGPEPRVCMSLSEHPHRSMPGCSTARHSSHGTVSGRAERPDLSHQLQAGCYCCWPVTAA